MLVGGDGEPIGTATLTTPLNQRQALAHLFARYGRHHPTGMVAVPEGRLSATVRYSSRTPVRGRFT